ncbi:monocarboxylate transporter 12-B-like [Diadema setosum]|uniref:monocarboxylate transporter 12-B-like n=1 Tax=Diadema setosum TaxID=31175 RepID=UPI003B3B45B3
MRASTSRGTTVKPQDSKDSWRYVIVLSKFTIMFLDAGLAKSFGVLLPVMITRYNTDYKTMGMICSMPATLTYFAAPLVHLLTRVVNVRALTVLGGFLYAVPVLCVPFVDSTILLGILTSTTGFGMAMLHFPHYMALNDYFPVSFVFYNTMTLFGVTLGAFCLPVIVEKLLEAYGESGTFLILGGICLNTVACGAVVRPPTDISGLKQKEEEMKREGHLIEDSTTSSLKTNSVQNMEKSSGCARSFVNKLTSLIFVSEPEFTLVTPAIFLSSYVLYAWMLFLVPQAEWLGIEPSRAVFLSSIAGISGIFGRILFLVLVHLDLNPNLIFAHCCVICSVSFFVFTLKATYVYQAVNAAIQGFVMFILDSLPHTITKKTVRRQEHLSIALTAQLLIFGSGALFGDLLSGFIFDVTRSYTVVFAAFGSIQIVVLVNVLVSEICRRINMTGAT